MTNDERAGMLAMISDVTLAILDTYPEMILACPDKFPSFVQGFSKGFSQKSVPGIFLQPGKDKFSVTVSLIVTKNDDFLQKVKKFQAELAEALSRAFPDKSDRVNIDIVKTVRL